MPLSFKPAATERTDLNGEWRFRIDAKGEGEKLQWYKTVPDGTEIVRVPHTWNIGKYEDHEGLAWYFRTVDISPLQPQKHIELHFGATFYLSRVWINGVEAGGHEGGHTEYFFDVTKLLKPGQNLIAVELDNRPTETSIPGLALKLKPGKNIWYDWWHYGGIVRDVWLAANDGSLIRRQQIRSELGAEGARVHDAVYLENSSAREQKLTISTRLYSPDGARLADKTVSVSIPAGAKKTVDFEYPIEKPELWDLDHDNLYSIRAALGDARGQVMDEKEDTFGNRKLEIRDRHLLLNGAADSSRGNDAPRGIAVGRACGNRWHHQTRL